MKSQKDMIHDLSQVMRLEHPQIENGLVKITMSCKNDIKKIDIDPSLLNDKEMLEDLIIVALKDTLQKVENTSSEKMSGLVPPGMNLPFEYEKN